NAIEDLVVGNTFVGSRRTSTAPVVQLIVEQGVIGLTVRGNTFRGVHSNLTAIQAVSGVQSLLLDRNTLTYRRGAGSAGILIAAGVTGGLTTSVSITKNVIHTGNAFGIILEPGFSGGADVFKVEGNDLNNNRDGIFISSLGNPVTDVDLG